MRYQTLFKEYVWLVNTIAKFRKITLEEINRRWVETEMSGGVEFARTTFNRHKDAIEDIFGIYIECDRMDGYRYYIGNPEVLEKESIQKLMLSTMTVSNLLSEHKNIQERVLLESVPSSAEFLSDMMRAMRHNVKVRIFYRKYLSEEGRERCIAPYCIKLFHRRWYVLGKTEDGGLRVFSLDRIHSLALTTERFDIAEDFEAESYFRDYVGVTIGDGVPVVRVVLRAYAFEKYYLRDLPLHASQREIAETAEYLELEYRLAPTEDFVGELMSLGNLVRVMEPQWLADKVKDKLRLAAAMYGDEVK